MAPPWTVVDGLTPADRTDVDDLLARVEHTTRDEALTEDARDRLESGTGLHHALRREVGGTLSGYALLVDEDGAVAAEPALTTFDDGLAAVLEGFERPSTLLLRAPDPQDEARLVARGWRPTRALQRLRRDLPAPPPAATELTVRAFVPGTDEAAWVAVNNAAFAGHPTQANMTVQRVAARERAEWFDPSGFLLFFDGPTLVASCWTKVHRCVDGDVGEIYVISVAPSAQGRGLGKLAVLTGLEHLSRAGLGLAELFVEERNTGALALYLSLGFSLVSRVLEYRHDPTAASHA